jgi:hypothetical protein
MYFSGFSARKEPTLDIEATLAIVRATAGFVDLYKVGTANYRRALTLGEGLHLHLVSVKAREPTPLAVPGSRT